MSSSHYQELVKEYRKLAKRADQRLVRLEKLSEKEGYENVLKYAYAKAEQDILMYGKPKNRPRFNTAPPQNTNSLQGKINDIKRFLDYPSSTKKGIESIYQARADTVNRNMGLRAYDESSGKWVNDTNAFTWEDLANFFNSKSWDKLGQAFGSKTVMMIIGQIKMNYKDISEAIRANKSIKIGDDKVSAQVENMIRNNEIDLSDFYGE